MNAVEKGTLVIATLNGNILAEGEIENPLTQTQLDALTYHSHSELKGLTHVAVTSIIRYGKRVSIRNHIMELENREVS